MSAQESHLQVSRVRESHWYHHPEARTWVDTSAPPSARHFHQRMPGYAPTKLIETPHLATELGVASVQVKDESTRLGLPAFKILGASWASAQAIATHTGTPATDITALAGAAAGTGIELVTATDGNHGRAVARMAGLLDLVAAVYVPAAMTDDAAAAIAQEGAWVVRVEGDYDDAVMAAAEYADADEARELVQDTAWEGYEQVPAWVVQGYRTLLAEIDEQFGVPDLVVVPVGVGSLAQAVVSHYRQSGIDPAVAPALLGVEPDSAACLLTSLRAGEPVSVATGGSVMAGLNCGTVSASAWPVLRQGMDAVVTVSDDQALQATEDLSRLGVSSGPSGAATLAGLRAALTDPSRREQLGVTAASAVVLLNTEGARPAGSQ